MVLHKNTKVFPHQRKEIFDKYHSDHSKVSDLAAEYHVSRLTIYKVIREMRVNQIYQQKSINKRYRTLEYGLKRLAKIEKKIELRLKKEAKRYNKSYPGEMIHFDCARLPWLEGESLKTHLHQYLFVAIDDFSRELYGAIMPDKSSDSATAFLRQVIEECPYTVECAYSDNGKEFKGNPKFHPFMLTCHMNDISQKFTQIARPQTNGKAERVIRTLKEQWHNANQFNTRNERKLSLNRFINYYNTVKPHAGINKLTPLEKLINYFFESVNNA
jgi:transposase InsO family protein